MVQTTLISMLAAGAIAETSRQDKNSPSSSNARQLDVFANMDDLKTNFKEMGGNFGNLFDDAFAKFNETKEDIERNSDETDADFKTRKEKLMAEHEEAVSQMLETLKSQTWTKAGPLGKEFFNKVTAKVTEVSEGLTTDEAKKAVTDARGQIDEVFEKVDQTAENPQAELVKLLQELKDKTLDKDASKIIEFAMTSAGTVADSAEKIIQSALEFGNPNMDAETQKKVKQLWAQSVKASLNILEAVTNSAPEQSQIVFSLFTVLFFVVV